MKCCTKCKEDKEESEFYFKNKGLGKRQSQCKVCQEKQRKSSEHYIKYRESYIRRAKERKIKLREHNREMIMSHLLNNPCKDCGETDPVVLEFDHINPEEKVHAIGYMISQYSWDKITQEINKCEVVCSNCHKRRTAKQFNWWKYDESKQQK